MEEIEHAFGEAVAEGLASTMNTGAACHANP
jgi:hypothetical protein